MRQLLVEVLDLAREQGAEFADVRIGEATGTSIMVQDGRADRVYSSEGTGAGVRALVEGAWGFATTRKLEADPLRQCARDAVAMARTASPSVTDPGMVADAEPVEDTTEADYEVDPRDVPLKERVGRMFELEEAARETDDRIVNTVARYGDSVGKKTVANTAGTYIERNSVRCNVLMRVTAQQGDIRQTATEHKSNAAGYELVRDIDFEEFSVKAADKAIALLSARRAPAGVFDVIVDPLICGLLVHEAFGHNCEADAVWEGHSILRGKVGEQVASDLVTICDDPTRSELNGHFVYDDAGTKAREHRLVENGVLQGFLHSLETAARFDTEPEGSARSSGATAQPLVRMSNTFIAPGDCTFEEMLEDTPKGLYLAGGHWGYVFTARGQFTCNVENAWAIENGELGQHYRNVNISGLTLETLQKVTAVGDDLQFELSGNCGKGGQSVPVDAGGPHVRIRDIVVGGQEDGR